LVLKLDLVFRLGHVLRKEGSYIEKNLATYNTRSKAKMKTEGALA